MLYIFFIILTLTSKILSGEYDLNKKLDPCIKLLNQNIAAHIIDLINPHELNACQLWQMIHLRNTCCIYHRGDYDTLKSWLSYTHKNLLHSNIAKSGILSALAVISASQRKINSDIISDSDKINLKNFLSIMHTIFSREMSLESSDLLDLITSCMVDSYYLSQDNITRYLNGNTIVIGAHQDITQKFNKQFSFSHIMHQYEHPVELCKKFYKYGDNVLHSLINEHSETIETKSQHERILSTDNKPCNYYLKFIFHLPDHDGILLTYRFSEIPLKLILLSQIGLFTDKGESTPIKQLFYIGEKIEAAVKHIIPKNDNLEMAEDIWYYERNTINKSLKEITALQNKIEYLNKPCTII